MEEEEIFMSLIRWSLVLVLLLVAGPMFGAVTTDESIVLDRWELQLGGFFTRLDTTLKVGDQEVNFEDDLDFDNAADLFRFSFGRVFGKRHEVRGTYFSVKRDSLLEFEGELDIGDAPIPIGAQVLIIYDTEFATLDYTYWMISKERTAFGVTGGLTLFDLKTGIDLVEPDLGSVIQDLSTEFPVPQIGLRVRQAMSQKFIFLGEASFLRFRDVSDFSGDFLTARLGVEYRAFRYLGFGAQMSLNRYDVRSDRGRARAEFQYDIEGFYVYLRGTFGGIRRNKS